MAATRHHEVLSIIEVRAKLSQITAEFERRGLDAEPVAFGSHRRPKSIILSWELWLELLPAIEDQLGAAEARQRLAEASSERVSFDDAAPTRSSAIPAATGEWTALTPPLAATPGPRQPPRRQRARRAARRRHPEAIVDLAEHRKTGKRLGARHVSGDLTGCQRPLFDLPDEHPRTVPDHLPART